MDVEEKFRNILDRALTEARAVSCSASEFREELMTSTRCNCHPSAPHGDRGWMQ